MVAAFQGGVGVCSFVLQVDGLVKQAVMTVTLGLQPCRGGSCF
jgi:hypothetical protein